MSHAFPHVHFVHPLLRRLPFSKAHRVVEQHFVVAHMYTDRRKSGQLGFSGDA